MTPVLIGLLLAIGLALAVVGVVAYPHLREGAPLLTPEGERLAREARQKAQALAGSAADALINREKSPGRDADPDDAALAGPSGPAPTPGSAMGTAAGKGRPPAAAAPSAAAGLPGAGAGHPGQAFGGTAPDGASGGTAPVAPHRAAAAPSDGAGPTRPTGSTGATGATRPAGEARPTGETRPTGATGETRPGDASGAASTGATGPVDATRSTQPRPAGPGIPGVPGDGVPRISSTRVVWASPPPQLRPKGATPPPGTTQVGDPGQGPTPPR